MAALAEIPCLVRAALCQESQCNGHGCDACETCHGTNSVRSDSFDRDGGGGSEGERLDRKPQRSEQYKTMSQDACQKRASKAAAAVKKRANCSASMATAGIFLARLCVGGAWIEYIMDDFFPAQPGVRSDNGSIDERNFEKSRNNDSTRGGLCLSRAHGPALWVSMLEKAYARARGSYSAVLGECRVHYSGTRTEPEKKAIAHPENCDTMKEKVLPGGVVARPAEILSVFTGVPCLHLALGRCGHRDAGAGIGGADYGRGIDGGHIQGIGHDAAEELWECVVNRS